MKVKEERGYMHSIEVSPSKYLLITKGENNFTEEQLDRHLLNQVIKVNTIGNKMYQH